MFLGKYFPPSLVTKLRNEITNFRQCPDESLFEACERYKLSVDHCPNHNMLPVTQIDTFYNGLTLRHRDTINVSAGGTFMKRRPEECYDLIKNMTAHHNYWDTSVQRSESSSSITSSYDPEIVALKAEMAEINKNLMKVLHINQQVYNGLTLRHHNTINAAAGGTFMKRRPEECYDLMENMTAHHNNWDTSTQLSESSSSITSSFDQEIIALKAEMAEINKNIMKVL
nr:reverse transcriptase domain-containing protein [Tanacetum cinerariifolium]